jgi:hypothetical protein
MSSQDRKQPLVPPGPPRGGVGRAGDCSKQARDTVGYFARAGWVALLQLKPKARACREAVGDKRFPTLLGACPRRSACRENHRPLNCLLASYFIVEMARNV